MSDFYELTTSTSDFKSRSNDVFDKLANLEKQHDIHSKTNTPISMPDDDNPSSSHQNPTIPMNAITFKKRSADDTFTRPIGKWKKYDLDDVNEHHLSNTGNRHALNDFLRTRVKPSIPKETKEDEIEVKPIFKQPIKKQILTTDDDNNNEDNQFISIRAPLPSNTIKTNIENDNDDDVIEYKLKSNRQKPRGVFSMNKKKSTKSLIESSEEKDTHVDDDDNDEDVDDELFEP